MIDDQPNDATERATDRDAAGASGISRRKALGRLGLYTAPVMLALLASESDVQAAATGVD